MPRQIEITGILPHSASVVWSRVITSEFILNMSYPAFRYEILAPAPAPERFQNGQYQMRAVALGFLPIDRQDVVSTVVADDTRGIYIIHNVSKGSPYSWDHKIALFAQTDGTCRYEDGIDIFGGPAPAAFRLITQAIFQMRRRNWAKEFSRVSPSLQSALT